MNIKKIMGFAIGPIGAAALGFITLPITTWFYSQEDIGKISMLQVAASFCVLIFSLGLDQSYVREYHESENKTALLKMAVLPGLVLLILSIAVVMITPTFFSELLFNLPSEHLSILVVVCILAAFLSRFLSLILRMQEKGFAYSISMILPKLIFLLVIGFYYLISIGFNLPDLILAHTISMLSVTLIYGWNTRTEWLGALKENIDLEKLKVMLKFGAPLIVGGATFWGLTAMDKIFLRNLSTFEELGIYSVSVSFAGAAVIFQSIFSTVWAPTVYKWAAEGINAEKIDQVTEHTLAIVVFCFIFIGLFSWAVTYILPAEYSRIQYIISACMAYPLFYTLSETTVVGLGVTRKSNYAMLSAIVAALINLVGNYLLVPEYGATGAAVSTALSFWFFLFLRTESSCVAWRKLKRTKMYCMTLSCLFLSIVSAFLGDLIYQYLVITWSILGIFSIFIFKRSLMAAVNFIFP
ncbi:oligosaccharide flippase family protein [Aeromonas salmonicida]|uniref:lipopolysaccharide biosynthesis protein n=1 Tax=Aeromonas salmonicida TaxID=645 RepID=UPI00259F091C|nr:oligosaccharide flippase family protein [Aeromonas salmonicida]ELI6433613.1 oligosaccharide flippase family protein [Aeromonas salmonicida subsp. salmonicida]MDM5061848.1 oligosaccharide flippase family protein [Aeromonas salmonicida]